MVTKRRFGDREQQTLGLVSAGLAQERRRRIVGSSSAVILFNYCIDLHTKRTDFDFYYLRTVTSVPLSGFIYISVHISYLFVVLTG